MIKNLRRFGVGSMLTLALLATSFVGQAQTIDPVAEGKITPDLYQLMQSRGPAAPVASGGLIVETNQVIVDGKIAIEAVANNGDGQGLLNQLNALGLTEGVAYKGMIFGYMPIDKLGELKNVQSLHFARSYYKPATNTGSVTSQGDAALKADVGRTTYGVTGAGTKVGVISDSYNALGGAPAGVASDDLPAGVQIIDDFTTGTDEGRAMAEIVHDVAPGAAIAFNTANRGQAGFAKGIQDLAAAGCQIIVDDVIYFAEPFFQDGIIAQAVDDVVNNKGVTYFSAAGNQARSSYQKAFSNSGITLSGGVAHDLGGGDVYQRITIPAGGRLQMIFQWDDPFLSAGGAGAKTNMDILVYLTNGTLLTQTTTNNITTGDPVEGVTLTNNGATSAAIDVVFIKRAGPDPTLIKWVNFGSRGIIIEADTKSGASYGHANATRAISVGATPFYNTPALNSALTTAVIEPFSSAGGTPILFNTAGIRLDAPVTRQKPEITSVDGGNNTFFGSDTNLDPDNFPNFFGTSAAAPHAAAVAALMKQKAPTITSAAILSTLENTALDMDDPSTPSFDTGFDFGTGYGFIQADRALGATQTITGTFSITGVTTVSCTTLSAGSRMISFTPQYAGVNGQPVSFSVANELLPTTAPGPYSLRVYTDNPVITLKATQSGTAGEASFSYNWLIACGGSTTPTPPTPPTTSAFSITGVTTINCPEVAPGARLLTFSPRYSGLNGQPVSFSVANELLPTTAPGPYSLRVYTDNPVITLKATQSGTAGEASFSYNWLVACNGGTPGSARVGAGSELTSKLKATILPNPVTQEFRIRIEGAQDQSVRLELSDLSGHSMLNKSVDVSSDDHQESLRFSQPGRGMYLLRVSTGQQAVTLKVIRE